MEIGVYIDEQWFPAVLNVTDSALLIKMENRSLVITLLEMSRISFENSYINITYMERKNGEAKKKIISINAQNLEEIYDLICAKKNKPMEENEGEYVPPENNAYTAPAAPTEVKTIGSMYVMTNNTQSVMPNQTEVSKAEISEENKHHQEELNQTMKPKQKSYKFVFVILLAVVLAGLTVAIKLAVINTKENMYTQGAKMWKNGTEQDYHAYKIYDDNTCKYATVRNKNITTQECSYNINGNEIKFVIDGIVKTYEWKIKPELKYEGKFEIVNVLELGGIEYHYYMATF